MLGRAARGWLILKLLVVTIIRGLIEELFADNVVDIGVRG